MLESDLEKLDYNPNNIKILVEQWRDVLDNKQQMKGEMVISKTENKTKRQAIVRLEKLISDKKNVSRP